MHWRCLIILNVVALIVSSATFAADNPTSAAVGRQVGAFQATLLTVEPNGVKESQFDSTKITRPTLYGFIGTHCPVTASYSGRLKALVEKYRKDIDIVFVYSASSENREDKVNFQREHGFAVPMIDDQGAKVKALLGAVRSTEMFLSDAKGKIVYHGAVDDSARDAAAVKVSYLAQAIDETLAGKPVTIASSQVFACGIH